MNEFGYFGQYGLPLSIEKLTKQSQRERKENIIYYDKDKTLYKKSTVTYLNLHRRERYYYDQKEYLNMKKFH